MQTTVDAHFLGTVHHSGADQRRPLNARRLQSKGRLVGLEKGLEPCRDNAARKLLDNVLVKAILVHHATLDLERGARHGHNTSRVERTQAIGNQPQGAARADKRLMPRIAQAMKRLDDRPRGTHRREVLIGHVIGIERRQRAVHVKKQYGGIGARINHMGSFRG